MKMLKLLLVLAVAISVVVACKPKKEESKEASKVLVLYYSQTSNTKTVAQEIATRLNADIEEITLVEP